MFAKGMDQELVRKVNMNFAGGRVSVLGRRLRWGGVWKTFLKSSGNWFELNVKPSSGKAREGKTIQQKIS